MQIAKEKKALLEELQRNLAGYSAEALLSYFLESFQGRIVLASSMAAEEDEIVTGEFLDTGTYSTYHI